MCKNPQEYITKIWRKILKKTLEYTIYVKKLVLIFQID